MIHPLDLRLLPAALGAWGISILAIKTALAPWALVALTATGAAALAWPRKAARHRAPWRGWLSQTIALGALVSVAVGGLALTQVQVRDDRIGRVLNFADSGSRIAVTLTTEVKDAQLGPSARGHLTEVTGGGRALTAPVPVFITGASMTWQVNQHVVVTGRLSRGQDHTVFLRVTDVQHEQRLSGIPALVGRVRDGVRNASDGLAPTARGLVPGVSIGDTRRVPQHLEAALKTTSLAHVTAVSGAHVAVVLATAMALTARAHPILKGMVGLAVVGMMVLVALPTASVLRASSMGALTLLGLITGRPRLALPVLFTVISVLLAIDPWLAGSIGFALSAAVTAGILTLSEPIAARLGGGLVARVLAVPQAAQIACAPLLLTFDASVAVYAVPANVLAMPALAPATILGLASALAALVSTPLAAAIANVASYFATWIATVAVTFTNLPGAQLPWLGGILGVVSLIGLNLGAAIILLRRRRAQA